MYKDLSLYIIKTIIQNFKRKEHTMAGSNFGKFFQISTWGESHGKALGVVIDGCPAGILLSEEDIQRPR